MTVPDSPKPVLWLLDTSSLLSLAVDPQLAAAIQQELSTDRCALLDVVFDELEELAKPGGAVRHLATAALGQLTWLGPVVDTAQLSDAASAAEIQDIIRAGRPLKHPREHWAESVILDIGERLTSVAPRLLSEDYDARVEASDRVDVGLIYQFNRARVSGHAGAAQRRPLQVRRRRRSVCLARSAFK